MVTPKEAKHTLVMFGKTGSGKSSILNSISGIKDRFAEGENLNSTTKIIDYDIGPFFNKPGENSCLFVDTPGFYDTESQDQSHMKNMVDFLKEVREGFTLLCFALPLTETKFDSSIQLSLKMLCTLFGDEIGDKIRIVFTHYNRLKETVAHKVIKKFKSELPSLLASSNIPYSSKSKFYIFDYDKEGGNLGELVEEIKQLPKFQSDVLKTLDDLMQQGLDFTDPIKVLQILTQNSKNMQNYTDKFSKLERVIVDLEKARKESEKLLNERDAKIKKDEMEMRRLQEEMVRVANEEKKKREVMMQQQREYLAQKEYEHQKQMERERQEMKERERQKQMEHERQAMKEKEEQNRRLIEELRRKNAHEAEMKKQQIAMTLGHLFLGQHKITQLGNHRQTGGFPSWP